MPDTTVDTRLLTISKLTETLSQITLDIDNTAIGFIDSREKKFYIPSKEVMNSRLSKAGITDRKEFRRYMEDYIILIHSLEEQGYERRFISDNQQ